jgi:hypothetical protein
MGKSSFGNEAFSMDTSEPFVVLTNFSRALCCSQSLRQVSNAVMHAEFGC